MNETLTKINNSLIAHVWNKRSFNIPLSKHSNVAYVMLAKKYCPRVLEASDSF